MLLHFLLHSIVSLLQRFVFVLTKCIWYYYYCSKFGFIQKISDRDCVTNTQISNHKWIEISKLSNIDIGSHLDLGFGSLNRQQIIFILILGILFIHRLVSNHFSNDNQVTTFCTFYPWVRPTIDIILLSQQMLSNLMQSKKIY